MNPVEMVDKLKAEFVRLQNDAEKWRRLAEGWRSDLQREVQAWRERRDACQAIIEKQRVEIEELHRQLQAEDVEAECDVTQERDRWVKRNQVLEAQLQQIREIVK